MPYHPGHTATHIPVDTNAVDQIHTACPDLSNIDPFDEHTCSGCGTTVIAFTARRNTPGRAVVGTLSQSADGSPPVVCTWQDT